MVRNNEYIIGQLLAMTEEERSKFLDGLKPDTLDYVNTVLDKAMVGKNLSRLKYYLDTHD